jgi:long-chain acyl-CoA synthetase
LLPQLADTPTAPEFDSAHPTSADDTASILYTSGTTGQPKGAQLTHGNLTATATAFRLAYGITPADRAGTALPLFHVYGQVCVLGTLLHAGGSVSLLPRFDADELLDMLRREQLTFIAGVPTMWNAMLRATGAGAGPTDFRGLRLASSGGASLPVEVMSEFEHRFGCAISEAYSLTETTGAAN